MWLAQRPPVRKDFSPILIGVDRKHMRRNDGILLKKGVWVEIAAVIMHSSLLKLAG